MRVPRSRRAYPHSPAVEVLQLSQEIAGLRRAQRSRSVIEQAKGLLMARLDCPAEQAFEQLSRISQETNTRVTEVAAGLLGLTSPVRPGPSPKDTPSSETPALPDQEAARYHLACAAMSAAKDGDAVAEALLDEGLCALGASAVVIAVREPDGTVQLVGSHGLARGLVSSWQRLPSGLRVGFLAAMDQGRPMWLNRTEAHRDGLNVLGAYGFRACLPLRRADDVLRVVVALWPDDPGLDLTGRAFVSALASAAGRRLRQLTSAEQAPVAAPAAHWLEAVLEALPGSFALLCPVADRSGRIVDWRFDQCSPQARDAHGHTGEELVGRRLLEVHPQLAGGALLRGYEQVLRTGRPFTHGPVRESLAALGGSAQTTIWIRAARLGDGILVTWRHDDQQTELLDRIALLQEAGPAGWARWDLQTGDVEWAPENAKVLGRPQPVSIEQLPDCATPADHHRLGQAVLAVLREHTVADLVIRTPDEAGAATVRVVLEPIVESRGRLTAVAAAFACDDAVARSGADGQPAPSAPSARASSDAGDLADTLRELRERARGLRLEQQAAAVIDRAKGMIAARRGCSIEAALEHLTATARRQERELVEVAGEVVGAVPPRGPRAMPAGAGFRPETYLGLRAVRTPGPGTEDEDEDGIAETLWRDGLRPFGADAVLLGVLEPDGAVRLVGAYGLPADLVGAWRRTPSTLNVAYLRAVATDRPLWTTRDEATRQGYQLLGDGEFRACLPLHQGGRIFGIASVLWSRPPDLDQEARAAIAARAESAGRRLSELLRATPRHLPASPAAHWAETILGALPPDFALLRPVRDGSGEIVDWSYEVCSPGTVDVAGRTAEQLVGGRLHRLYPHLLTTGMAQAYRAAADAGGSAGWGPSEFDVETPAGVVTVTMSGQASKFGDGILIHWRREEQDRLGRRLRLLERATGSGWAEWSLAGGETAWSPAVYEILRRDPGRGPVKLGALHRYAVAEDEAALTEAVRRLTRLHHNVDIVVRVRRRGSVTPVRFTARPVVDEWGRVAAVRAVFSPTPPSLSA